MLLTPPLTVADRALAVLLLPPLTAAKLPLAVLLNPPLTVATVEGPNTTRKLDDGSEKRPHSG